MSDEVELKLEVEPGSLATIRGMAELGGAKPRTRAQRSVYFDTADQDLRTAGFSLRIRYADGKRLQTMKAEAAAAAGLFVRQEWEREIDGDHPHLDGDADAPRELFGGQPLGPLLPTFTADVTRTIWDVRYDGAEIEVVLDEGQVAVEGRVEPVSEVELELTQGRPAALFGLAHALGLRLPIRIGVLTKSERGYRLIDGRSERAVKSEPVALVREMTAAEAFQAIARACLRQYRLNETLLLASRGAQPLHQARVALRRLRSALSLFKPLLRDDRYERFRVGLRALAAQLGTARNLDVLIGRVGDAPLAATLLAARERAYDAVCTALNEPEARLLLLELTEWIAIGAWRTDEATAPLGQQSADRFAAALLDRSRRRLKRSGKRLAKIDDEARHEVRILAKRLRYAAEFFSELYGSKPQLRRRKAFLAALERLQSRLGDLNDEATGHDVLRAFGCDEAAAAELLGRTIDRRALLDEAAEGYDELIDLKRFWR